MNKPLLLLLCFLFLSFSAVGQQPADRSTSVTAEAAMTAPRPGAEAAANPSRAAQFDTAFQADAPLAQPGCLVWTLQSPAADIQALRVAAHDISEAMKGLETSCAVHDEKWRQVLARFSALDVSLKNIQHASSSGISSDDVDALREVAEKMRKAADKMKDGDSILGSILVNIVSNRIDNFLFGESAASNGKLALLTALIVFASSVIKLVMAIKPPAGISGLRKSADLVLSIFFFISATFGLLVMLLAGSAEDETQRARALHDMRAELSACQSQLAMRSSANTLPLEQGDAADALAARVSQLSDEKMTAGFAKLEANLVAVLDRQQAAPADYRAVVDLLARVESSCNAARDESANSLRNVGERIDNVYDARMGWFFKLLVLLGFAGIAALVWRAFFAGR